MLFLLRVKRRVLNVAPVWDTIAKPTAEPTATVMIATIIIIIPNPPPLAILLVHLRHRSLLISN